MKPLLLIGMLLGLVAWIDLIVFLLKYPIFKRELRYINMEILRSDYDERKYWEYCKKRLIISAFLFSRY